MWFTPSTKLLDIKKRENGVVYTPSTLATYIAEKVIGFAVSDLLNSGLDAHQLQARLSNFKIIDTACGEGDLLTPSWHALISSLQEKKEGNALLELKANSVLCGIDIDKESVAKTELNIRNLNTTSSKKYNLLATNALFPEDKKLGVKGWESVKKHFGAEKGFDVLIANPPWGASTVSYDDKLEKSEYTLNKGQYDTSDIFVELAVSLVKQGGYFAFIIPDSLFGFERRELRKLLLQQTEIKFIGRLGEKIFEGVNRACVVLICKKTQPKSENRVNCMRLNPSLRRKILKGEMSYMEVERMISHSVKQTRFSVNEELLFDIDTQEQEMQVLEKISRSKRVMGDYVFSSRGVELSKTGKICKCNACGYWSPLPNTQETKCSHCNEKIDLRNAEARTIISKTKFKGSKPILVGESVRRYSISSRLWIAVDNKGINYKSISLYYEPKILVRKTGVGITATIDYSSAFTNQVVYIFKPRLDAEYPVPIEFVLAVMNSRAIYYLLLKKYGEAEWRTHPYLTQSQVLNLPMPDLSSKEAKLALNKVAGLLKPYLEKQQAIPKNIDAKVEFLVASMFALSKKDYEVIYKTLSTTQGLIPVRELSAVGVDDIFK
jgi:adenine-specific DNA-methyltransferase